MAESIANRPRNPNVSVDCVVFGFDDQMLKVLLIEQRNGGDFTPQLALPGDLVWQDENLDEAATRVLKELTHLEGIYLKQFKTFGDPDRVKNVKDQDWLRTFREDPSARVITVAYYSLVKMENYRPEAASFAGEVIWQNVDEIPELGFDHNKIVNEALARLREEFEYKHIAFELLPQKFTISMLQRLHEIVLGIQLDKRNFRKKLKKSEIIHPLDEKQRGVDHKPAQLFEYKPKRKA
jgi:8-oxo-dGTP diphosphatase